MFFFAGLGSFMIPLLFGAVRLDRGYQILAFGLLPVALLLFLTPSPGKQSGTHASTGQISSFFLILFALLAFIYVGTEVSFGGWILSYYQSANPDGESASYMLNSLFYLAILIGRFVAILLAVFFQPRHLIWISLGGAALSAALMSLLPSQPWSIWLGTAGMGLSIAAIFPTTFNYVGSKAQLSGKQNGLVWAVGSLGAMILPWVIGKTFDFQGVLNMMSILLVLWLIAGGLFLIMSRMRSQKIS
jgi:FHS family Na+ dependent glucose MFS transporter 1